MAKFAEHDWVVDVAIKALSQNVTSPVYIEKGKQIVAQLADHYKQHQAVIGRQIDNELNCHVNVSFAASDHEAFRR